MKHVHVPYGARSDAELRRNLDRLGTRWQEHVPPEPSPETLQQAYERGYRDGVRDAGSRNFWRGFFWGSWT